MGKLGSLMMEATNTGFSRDMAFKSCQTKKSISDNLTQVLDMAMVHAGRIILRYLTHKFTRENGNKA